jgi:CubicO group peptidase (beta-lactamase class C family)
MKTTRMHERIDDKAALDMGFSKAGLDSVWETIRYEIERKTIPGAVAIISIGGKRIRFASGYAYNWEGKKVSALFDTIYDSASLTKVTITLFLILRLIDRESLSLDDLAAEFLPKLGKGDKEEVTIRHLLTHSAGFPSGYDLHSHGWSRDEMISFLCKSPLVYAPGSQVIYSDISFILLGEIAAKLTGMSLDEAAHSYIFGPLEMGDSSYCPVSEQLERIAATEYAPDIQRCWHGIVHDENARAMGGIAGHAGLFATADDLMNYAEMWLAGGRHKGRAILSEAVVKEAIVSQTSEITNMYRGLGWVLKGDPADTSGELFSDYSFGHTGFTGTSLLMDPKRQLAVVLLTNRVHYGRDKSISLLRETFHTAIIKAFND